MKATGIVRRVDDLGRIVIPKEIRRTLNIKDGDPMEMFLTEDGRGLTFMKFQSVENVADLLKQASDLLDGDDEKKPYKEMLDWLVNKLGP